MRGLKIPLLIIIPLSFVLGLAWGYKVYRDREIAEGKRRSAVAIKILAYKGVFPRQVITAFTRDSGIGVLLTEASTPEELWSLASDPKSTFDLISYLSYQVPLAAKQGRIQRIDHEILRNAGSISPDLQRLPRNTAHEWTVPMLWGVTGLLIDVRCVSPETQSWKELLGNQKLKGQIGLLPSTIDVLSLPEPIPYLVAVGEFSDDFAHALPALIRVPKLAALQISHGETAFLPDSQKDWKFILPKEKATLWVLSMALAKGAKFPAQSLAFVDYALETPQALAISRGFKQASANRSLETASIDERLKPSFLRRLPLSGIAIPMWDEKSLAQAQEARILIERLTSPVGY